MQAQVVAVAERRQVMEVLMAEPSVGAMVKVSPPELPSLAAHEADRVTAPVASSPSFQPPLPGPVPLG
jgi:hypothetical protein